MELEGEKPYNKHISIIMLRNVDETVTITNFLKHYSRNVLVGKNK